MQGSMIQPTRDRILVERLEGHGIERVTKGGIIIPATTEKRAKTKNDTFHARVLALGPKAPSELVVGDTVIVQTWADGDGSTLYTGVAGLERNQLFIEPDDIVCIVDGYEALPEAPHPLAFLREEAAGKWLGDPIFALGGRP